MVYSSPTGTVGSLAPSTHTVFGNTFYSSSIHHCGLKLSIKLQENNYPIWNQKVEEVIFTHRVHKIVANPHIPPKFKTEQDHIDGNVYAEYEAWIVQDQVVFIWLFATISKSVLHCVLACKHAFEVWDKNYYCFHSFNETFTPTSASSNMHASASSIDQVEVSTSDTNAIAMLAHTGRGRGGRDSGRSGRGSNFERGQSIQQNWCGRGRGQRGGRSNHSNFECYKCGKYGHYGKDYNSFKCFNCDKVGHLGKDCRIEKKVEETTNLTLEAEANEGFLLMAQNEINTNDNVWYLDSGASNHMCGHIHLFKEMRKIEDGNVSFGDASKVKVEGKGTIRYLQKDGLIGSIQDVYYVPNLKTNILSLGQLTKKGYSILMKERILHLKDKLGHLIARVEMERNRMYKLNLINVREKCLQVSVEEKASLWHLRFGHLHHAGLKRC
ncbi:hypothetical protein KIW84_042753 [Lathyrus oleraceus]|uniref:CCHC-type domain-containing protein n=1 Tax=Pisum sativum TaxID=3888 RepID=A0A9D4XFD3_PEA|nr:hypothetical protein KIW84_042753 [Pisum sativum]